MLPSWVPRVTNGDHTTLRGAGGQRVRRTKLYTHTGRREHDGPTVVGTTCRPVTVSHVVPTYSTYVTHSRHLHTTVRVSYLRPTSYGVARVPLDTLLPTRRVGYVRIFQHTLLLEHSATITLRSRGGHTLTKRSVDVQLSGCHCCCRLSCLLSTGGDITFLPKRDQSAAGRAARGMHRALCARARARGLAAASYGGHLGMSERGVVLVRCVCGETRFPQVRGSTFNALASQADGQQIACVSGALQQAVEC